MASVSPEGLSGVIGNIVFYTMNGKQYARAKPGPRTKSRKKKPEHHTTRVFAVVSSNGTPMLKRMSVSFLFRFRRETYNNMRGWMRQQYMEQLYRDEWPLTAIGGRSCQLNPDCDLRDFIILPFVVADAGKGKIKVQLPALVPARDIKAPLRTRSVTIRIVVTTASFEMIGPQQLVTEVVQLDYNDTAVPAQTLVLATRAPAGHAAIVAVALEFETFVNRELQVNREGVWLPGAVLAMGKLK